MNHLLFHRPVVLLSFVLLSIFIVSCFNESDSSSSSPSPGFTISGISGNTTEAGGQATFTIMLNSEPDGNVVIDVATSDSTEGKVSSSTITFTTSSYASNQTVTVTGANETLDDGDIAYTIQLTVNSGSTTDTTGYASLDPNDVSVINTDDDDENVSDPLYAYQWHLNNTGQSSFASTSGVSGEDINLQTTWSDNIKGSGIKVAVVDSGLEIAHEDIANNVESEGSWDFVNNDTDPTSSETEGDHGTSVSGLIMAVENNGLGGRGVSPGASVVGYNFIANSDIQTITNFISALGGSTDSPNSSNVDIFNQSYGAVYTNDGQINSTVEAQYLDGVTNLRSGKGAIYIKSSGNGFQEDYNSLCSDSDGLTCENSNMDPTQAIPWQIVVGAIGADGIKSSYSTAGSSLWISAPGGEFGYDASRGWSGSSSIFEPAMITLDQSGCSVGYATSSNINNYFQDNNNDLNPDCNYTSQFNGTSSAAPVLSGAMALLLESNSDLTWRDVKFILASTAKQVDSGISSVNLTVNGSSYEAEQAWVTNAAGFKFHNWYGFGRVDVDAAVSKATGSYTNLSTQLACDYRSSGTLTTSIPDNSVTGASDTLSISDSVTIESIQIKVSLTHTYLADLAIELTSPSGTKSILFNARNGFGSSDDLDEMILLSNAFYGESSSGSWTIKIVDTASQDTGTLTKWEFKVIGRDGSCSP